MIKKAIDVGGQKVEFAASAALPRVYRALCGRDIFADLRDLSEAKIGQLTAEQLEVFEDIAYAMARKADPSVPGTADEWLDTIDGVFSVYHVLPQIIDLWGDNLKADVKNAVTEETAGT